MWKWVIVLCISFFSFRIQVLVTKTNDSQEETRGTSQDDVGDPLILTSLLEEGKAAEAQELAKVKPDIGGTTSYSGYFTVNKDCESNLFFWFFPAQKNWEQVPLVLWVQGGPGSSMMGSIFEDVGPFTFKEELGKRQHSWNLENNLLFVDQPVGSGYSFSRKHCYAENQTALGRELYSAVVQFLKLFPVLSNNRFYIVGHSYGGHFAPALAYTIHKNNPSAQVKINLSGMMIGNGWMDALYQSDYGSFLYQLGFIDEEARHEYYHYQKQLSEEIKNEDYQKAFQTSTYILIELFIRYVGNVSLYNYLEDVPSNFRPYENFVQSPQFRKAIHVGDVSMSFFNLEVMKSLGVDFVMTVKPWVEELLEHYFIVFYSGQLDIICAYPMSLNFLRSLKWSGRNQYISSPRQKWCEGSMAGYFRGSHRLYDVLVRGAGHFLSRDQPLRGFALLSSITSAPLDNPLHALGTC